MGIAVVAILGGARHEHQVVRHPPQAGRPPAPRARDYAEAVEPFVAAGGLRGVRRHAPPTPARSASPRRTAVHRRHGDRPVLDRLGVLASTCSSDTGLQRATLQARSKDGRATEQSPSCCASRAGRGRRADPRPPRRRRRLHADRAAVAVVILGVIVVPLVNVIIGFLRTADATTGRLTESHDVQFAAAYFAQDVQAAGVRDYTVTEHGVLPAEAVDRDRRRAAAAGTYPCGAAGPAPGGRPARLGRLHRRRLVAAAQTRVAYVVENGDELHRVVCAGSATPASDVRIAQQPGRPLRRPLVRHPVRRGRGLHRDGAAVPASVSLHPHPPRRTQRPAAPPTRSP